MKCPKCLNDDTRVQDSRTSNEGRVIRRRRHCEQCSYRFTTFERVEGGTFKVIKKDGTRELYSREKLEKGIWRACHKRPVTAKQIQDMLIDLESEWARCDEVDSWKLGDDVMTQLRNIDDVAYIRFASVYRKFQAVDEFAEELEKLKKHTS